MAPNKASRKRASSDQLREQANRNVRPARDRSLAKVSSEGPGNISRKFSSPAITVPVEHDNSGDDHSEYEQQESATDVDEENIHFGEEDGADDPRRTGNRKKAPEKFHRDARMMALAGRKHTVVTVVSDQQHKV